jgi:peptidoglycan/xylan/chitin deacetylase (PgdA/CDA1 family)
MTDDWIAGLPREPIRVKAWPGGKRVAVCFVLYVETWGIGHGPVLRPDTVARRPDLLNESFRQYAIEWGVPRVGRLMRELQLPISIALNASFLEEHPDAWRAFRAHVPTAPIVAHGMNNSTNLLPLEAGFDAQREYIRRTLDIIETGTGVRPRGWTSPSVFPNAETFTAVTSEGIAYSLDTMDSDMLSRFTTTFGPLALIPYPTVSVDMGQFFERLKGPRDMELLWIDYVDELAREAAAYPDGDATVVAIGVHPFVVGTPDGAAAFRRALEHCKNQDLVWVTDVEAVLAAAAV